MQIINSAKLRCIKKKKMNQESNITKKDKIIQSVRLIWKIFIIIFQLIFFYFIINWLIKYSNLEFAKVILDYLKVVIWPIVVIIIAFCFKIEISNLINRIISGELPGFKFNATSKQEKKEESDLKSKLKNVPIEEKNKLEELIQEKEKALTSASQSIDQLKNELVQKEIELDFERIYNIIFASQIDLLNKMVILGYLGIQNIIQHFILVQRTFEPTFSNWDITNYLQFLYDQKLIERQDSHTIKITDKGKAFLQYLSIMNYQKNGI